MKNPRCETGFSLLELLMASAVGAAAAAMLVGGLIASNRSSVLRVERAVSTQLLASQLALLDDVIPSEAETSGNYPAPLQDFTWALEWTETPLAPLAETTLTVKKGDHATHVVTYRSLAQ